MGWWHTYIKESPPEKGVIKSSRLARTLELEWSSWYGPGNQFVNGLRHSNAVVITSTMTSSVRCHSGLRRQRSNYHDARGQPGWSFRYSTMFNLQYYLQFHSQNFLPSLVCPEGDYSKSRQRNGYKWNEPSWAAAALSSSSTDKWHFCGASFNDAEPPLSQLLWNIKIEKVLPGFAPLFFLMEIACLNAVDRDKEIRQVF